MDTPNITFDPQTSHVALTDYSVKLGGRSYTVTVGRDCCQRLNPDRLLFIDCDEVPAHLAADATRAIKRVHQGRHWDHIQRVYPLTTTSELHSSHTLKWEN